MKKVSTGAARQIRNLSEEKLTIGLDLGDRSSYFCVLDESGAVVLGQKMATSATAREAVFAGMVRSRMALEA